MFKNANKCLEAEQTSALLAIWVDNQSRDKQSDCDTDRDLDHAETKTGNWSFRKSASTCTGPIVWEVLTNLVGVFDAGDQGPTRGETRGD